MPYEWGQGWGPEKPKPPLTIYPQVGPAEQMMHRSLRERGLDKPAWDLARKTHTSLIPLADMAGAGGDYERAQNKIRVGYGAGGMGDEGTRSLYAHELRHAYQDSDDPNRVTLGGGPLNEQFMQDARQWEGAANAIAIQEGSNLYGGVSPEETDAYISMNPDITPDQMPPHMRKYYQGWWKDGAKPDSAAQRAGGWGQPYHFEDDSVGIVPLDRRPYKERARMIGPETQTLRVPQPRSWLHRAVDEWRNGIKPDVTGNWG